MNFIRDVLSLQINCILQLAVREPTFFRVLIVVALLCGALGWLACNRVSRLINIPFRLTLAHQALSVLAGLIAFLFAICFPSLKYTRDAALSSIGVWRAAIGLDQVWAEKTYQQAYRKVQALHVEDFSGYPPPESAGTRIPVNRPESRIATASVYANSAASQFRGQLPFLSVVVWPHSELPTQVVRRDVDEWDFSHGDYPVSRAIDIAATQIRSQLDPQTPRVVWMMRLIATLAFVLLESIPFGIISLAAYRDIKINT